VSACSANHYNTRWSCDASGEIPRGLAGVLDPEAKASSSARVHIDISEEDGAQIGGASSRPGNALPLCDRERQLSPAALGDDKSHHNFGGMPARMNMMKLVEPLRELSRMRFACLAAELGPVRKIFDGPASFPGPGLAIPFPATSPWERC